MKFWETINDYPGIQSFFGLSQTQVTENIKSMTAQEQYLQQNALGFEGDGYLNRAIEELVKSEDIKAIVETGTFMGASTVQFVQMVDTVFTIEVNQEFSRTALKRFEATTGTGTIIPYLGSSVDWLGQMLDEAKQYGNIFWFCDSHWGANNPLLQELEIVRQSGLKPVICIHDFKVPGHPELGFDSYNGQDYDWNWIYPSIERIYGQNGYDYWYNTEAEGAKRGVIFIKAKK